MYTIRIDGHPVTGLHWNDPYNLPTSPGAQPSPEYGPPSAAEVRHELQREFGASLDEAYAARAEGDEQTAALEFDQAEWMRRQRYEVEAAADAGVPEQIQDLQHRIRQVDGGSLDTRICLDQDAFAHQEQNPRLEWQVRVQRPGDDAGAEIFSEEWDWQQDERVMTGYRVSTVQLDNTGQPAEVLNEQHFPTYQREQAEQALAREAQSLADLQDRSPETAMTWEQVKEQVLQQDHQHGPEHQAAARPGLDADALTRTLRDSEPEVADPERSAEIEAPQINQTRGISR